MRSDESYKHRRAEQLAAVPHALAPKGNTELMDPAEHERRLIDMMHRAAAGLPLFGSQDRPDEKTD